MLFHIPVPDKSPNTMGTAQDYHPGRLNQTADVLFHIPVPDKSPNTMATAQDGEEVVNKVCTTSCMSLSSRQKNMMLT